MLPVRQDIVQIFSTFVRLEGGAVRGWLVDPRLRRSMADSLTTYPQLDDSPQTWARYWYQSWKTAPPPRSGLARNHLAAYLQQSCFWSAQKAARDYPNSQCNITDYFNVAFLQLDQVLQGFEPEQGATLEGYAKILFDRSIKTFLRQLKIADSSSDWGLLRKTSRKLLIESLQNAGLGTEAIGAYTSLWSCFKEIYIPPQANISRQLPAPDPALLRAICDLYTQENPSGPRCSSAEQWLLSCAKAIRSYSYPQNRSLDRRRANDEETSEILPSAAPTPSELLIQIEGQREQTALLQQIEAILRTALAELDREAQHLLQLHYQEGKTQTEMARELKINQSTISRRIDRSKSSILLALVDGLQAQRHNFPDLDLLKSKGSFLEEWLQNLKHWPEDQGG